MLQAISGYVGEDISVSLTEPLSENPASFTLEAYITALGDDMILVSETNITVTGTESPYTFSWTFDAADTSGLYGVYSGKLRRIDSGFNTVITSYSLTIQS